MYMLVHTINLGAFYLQFGHTGRSKDAVDEEKGARETFELVPRFAKPTIMQRLSIESHGGNEEFSQLLDVTEEDMLEGIRSTIFGYTSRQASHVR